MKNVLIRKKQKKQRRLQQMKRGRKGNDNKAIKLNIAAYLSFSLGKARQNLMFGH